MEILNRRKYQQIHLFFAVIPWWTITAVHKVAAQLFNFLIVTVILRAKNEAIILIKYNRILEIATKKEKFAEFCCIHTWKNISLRKLFWITNFGFCSFLTLSTTFADDPKKWQTFKFFSIFILSHSHPDFVKFHKFSKLCFHQIFSWRVFDTRLIILKLIELLIC